MFLYLLNKLGEALIQEPIQIDGIKMSLEKQSGFFVLPFGIDGVPVGEGFWEYAKLSPHWLDVCKQHIERFGPASDVSLRGDLSHIRIKLSSASGAALLTVFVTGKVLTSALLLSGQSFSVDRDLAQMFVESLKRAKVVESPSAFAQAISDKRRPLLSIVHWPDDSIREEDHELVRELALHFAGAFFDKSLRESKDLN